jgi:hypothetical protein
MVERISAGKTLTREIFTGRRRLCEIDRGVWIHPETHQRERQIASQFVVGQGSILDESDEARDRRLRVVPRRQSADIAADPSAPYKRSLFPFE